MKVVVTNKTDTELYAVAATYTEDDGTETQVINFFLSNDPVDGVTPVQVPHPPANLEVDFPARPYFNPPPDYDLMVGELIDPATGDLIAIVLAVLDAADDAEDPNGSAPPAKPTN